MGLLLVRYAEMGLKSDSVRRRFERILLDNILASFAERGVEAILTSERGRIFVETDRADEAADILSMVFGVASLSRVMSFGSDMEEMRSFILERSGSLLPPGSSFALRVRRTGTHRYTSMDVAKELGAVVLEVNRDKEVRVDLTSPDIEIFIEIRGKRAFLFTEYIKGPGGLPMGSQGRVLAVVKSERDTVAAWLLMKRGCRAIVVSEEEALAAPLKRWAPGLKVIRPNELGLTAKENRALAVVFGHGVEDIEEIKRTKLPLPAFYPLVGMSSEEIEKRFRGISG